MPTETLVLWPHQATTADLPTLTLYPTANAVPRGGVLVLPGGAYMGHAPHEGPAVAERLQDAGFDAAVLHYRLAPDHQHPAMIYDAQRGMRMMRQASSVQAQQIAVMGFSAGGHLASTLSVHADRCVCEDDDLAAHVSAKPDAAVLGYPVIDLLDSATTHEGSKQHLLGPAPPPELAELMSTYRHVTRDTPPTFLWHTADDDSVPMQNSLLYAAACREARVPVELHVYESGIHGIGLADDHPEAKAWFPACLDFLDRHFA